MRLSVCPECLKAFFLDARLAGCQHCGALHSERRSGGRIRKEMEITLSRGKEKLRAK